MSNEQAVIWLLLVPMGLLLWILCVYMIVTGIVELYKKFK